MEVSRAFLYWYCTMHIQRNTVLIRPLVFFLYWCGLFYCWVIIIEVHLVMYRLAMKLTLVQFQLTFNVSYNMLGNFGVTHFGYFGSNHFPNIFLACLFFLLLLFIFLIALGFPWLSLFHLLIYLSDNFCTIEWNEKKNNDYYNSYLSIIVWMSSRIRGNVDLTANWIFKILCPYPNWVEKDVRFVMSLTNITFANSNFSTWLKVG